MSYGDLKMSNIFKDLVYLQAELALLPQEDKYEGLRTAVADVVTTVLHSGYGLEMEGSLPTATTVESRVEVCLDNQPLRFTPRDYDIKVKTELSILKKIRLGTIVVSLTTFTHVDGEVTPLFIVTDENLQTWLTYPGHIVYMDTNVLEPHYELYNETMEEVADRARGAMCKRITDSSGGKSRVYNMDLENGTGYEFVRCAGSDELKFTDMGGTAWYTTRKEDGKLSGIVFSRQVEAAAAKEYRASVTRATDKYRKHEEKPKYVFVPRLTERVRDGEYTLSERYTYPHPVVGSFAVYILSWNGGELQSEYRYVVGREPSGSIRNRVFANLRDAKEYGGTLE